MQSTMKLFMTGCFAPLLFLAGFAPAVQSAPADPSIGRLTLNTSDRNLAAAFEWAKKQALAYAFTGDRVGNWYEAALPGREAFCMRDTAHQALGAHVLGLASYTRNMLRKFAENISDSKDWCSYWEINKDNLPASVDYHSDAEFWYNLPANFDVLDACYRMYVWTGDREYIKDPVFLNFYKRTVHDYIERWDLGVDRIMDRQRIMNVKGHLDPANRFQVNRGIPSYDESDRNFTVAIDQLAVEYAGYVAYARLEQLRGEEPEAEKFLARAAEVKSFLNREWWDASSQNYYSRVGLDHKLKGHDWNMSLLYYGAAADGPKSAALLNDLLRSAAQKDGMHVEEESHVPEILYRYGKADAAYSQILDLTRNDKQRREYPEVAYSVLGAIVTGLMGIQLEAAEPQKALREDLYVDRTVTTRSGLTAATEWAEVQNVPIRGNDLTVRHDGLRRTTLLNGAGPSLLWKACFPGSVPSLLLNGKTVPASHVMSDSCLTTAVGSGDTGVVEAPR